MLHNRPSFQQEAVNFIQRATLTRTHFDLFYGALRVDGADTQAMKVVADLLRQLTRPQPFLARYGPLEFAVLRLRGPMGVHPHLLRDQLLPPRPLPMDLDGPRINPHTPETGRQARKE